MKRFVASILTLALVAGFSTSQVFARGGGHGGGHHGGQHHSGHHSSHHAHHGQHTHHHYAHHGNHHPFSHDWGRHHGAWGWGNGGYGWGNPWAAAGLGAAAGWLGADALADDYPVDNTYYTSDNVAQDDSAQDDNAQADNSQQTADAEQPETFEPEYSSEQAGQLASGGTNEPAGAQYLPLGVYTFAPAGQSEATAMLHLAVSKEGVLRGSYYDLKADKAENIQGAVDKKTGVAAFTVEPNSKVVYQTTLRDLTDQSGPVAEHGADGKTTEWTIAKAEENPSQAKTGEKSTGAENAEPAMQK